MILEPALQLQPRRIVRWTTESRAVSASDIDAERKKVAAQYGDLDPAMFRRMVAPLVSEKRPVSDRFPAFSSAMVGRDDRVWIREYPRPQATQTQRWMAFGSDGRFACRTTLPELDQILEFGADYLLALDRDDLGVERIVQYSIAAPAAGR